MSTCFSCFEPKSGHLPACRACAAVWQEAYGAEWFRRPEVSALINQHRRQDYQSEQLAKVLQTPEYQLRLETRTLQDDIVDELHSGASTKEIVEKFTGRRSQAQLYREVRKARTLTGLWEGARR